jgi:adenosine deaminase
MGVTMSDIRKWLATLPKAELHLHLEGAIPLDALWGLIEKYGSDPSVPTREDLPQRLTYADFPAFIDAWIWKNGFLREYEDFTYIAEAVAQSLARQHIRYAEIFFAPSRFAHLGLSTHGLAQAIRRGLDRVPATEIWLIPDLVRDHGPQQAARTLREVAEVRDCGIVGIGMGGSEHLHPPEPFAQVYADARALGLRTSVHAGEAAGAESVRGALEVLAVDRIGHATRAEEDPSLVALLAERRVPIELCPLSNVATGVVAEIRLHPVRRYQDLGLVLTEEYAVLHERFGFSAEEIRQLVLNAVQAAWRPECRGPPLAEVFTGDPGWRLPSFACA